MTRTPVDPRGKIVPISGDYAVIDRETAECGTFHAWREHAVAEHQDSAYRVLIWQMRAGRIRRDLAVAARAVRCTRIRNPSLLEVGCGSGYYCEVLSYLLRRPLNYVGLDYSEAMIRLAFEHYPQRPFLVADAAALPFDDEAFDIVLNGVSLMHILRFEEAIAENHRVARRWCIFHTVPVLRRRETTFLSKKAYGEPAVEIIFNEGELCHALEGHGLKVRRVLGSIPYDLKAVLGESTVTKTYVCEVTDR